MTAVCGGCVHCHELPVQADLTRQQECRANPPSVQFLPTQQGIVKLSGFPVVGLTHPACGIYEQGVSPISITPLRPKKI